MLEGFQIGNDARDVLAEAIEWWERQLAIVEQEAFPDKKAS
jgi:hypothetical protein